MLLRNQSIPFTPPSSRHQRHLRQDRRRKQNQEFSNLSFMETDVFACAVYESVKFPALGSLKVLCNYTSNTNRLGIEPKISIFLLYVPRRINNISTRRCIWPAVRLPLLCLFVVWAKSFPSWWQASGQFSESEGRRTESGTLLWSLLMTRPSRFPWNRKQHVKNNAALQDEFFFFLIFSASSSLLTNYKCIYSTRLQPSSFLSPAYRFSILDIHFPPVRPCCLHCPSILTPTLFG